MKQSFASLKAGCLEIRPGQSKQLAFMRRLAPDFINRQLWKASKKLVPVSGIGRSQLTLWHAAAQLGQKENIRGAIV